MIQNFIYPKFYLSIISFIVTNRKEKNNYTHKFLGSVETGLIITIINTLVYKMNF